MVIHHFSAAIISRSKGQSSITASAYRAAEKIRNIRTTITYNFIKNKPDLIH